MTDAVAAFQQLTSRKPVDRSLAGLVATYLSSPEYSSKLAPRTQTDYRRALDVVVADLGAMEVRALESRRMRSALLDWRDSYAAHPKTADGQLAVLATVLQWAADRGVIDRNPLTNWPRIYRANRAELIWEAEHLALLLAKVSTDAGRLALLFAAHTGLRVGDVPRVPWTAVKDHAIVWQTAKSRGRRTVVIPITDELRAILASCPRVAVTILTNQSGKPWTSSGLQTTLQKAKQRVASGFKSGGSPIADLRFHDLRGTAATHFIRAGVPLEDVATIMGWSKERVNAIASRYVTFEEVGLAIAERMKRNKTRERL